MSYWIDWILKVVVFLLTRDRTTSNANAMARVTVGPEKTEFLIHKAFLCHYSPYFDRALNGQFIEGQTQAVDLPEENTEAFATFVDWVYTQKLDSEPTIGSGDAATPMGFSDAMTLLVRVWCLADYLQVPKLQNLAINALISHHSLFSNGRCPVEQLPLVYSLTPAGSNLRKLFVNLVGRDLPDVHQTDPATYPHEMLLDLVAWLSNVHKPAGTPEKYTHIPSDYHVPRL